MSIRTNRTCENSEPRLGFAARDLARYYRFNLEGHPTKLGGQMREGLALRLVSGELAEEKAILGVGPKLFQPVFQVLHRPKTFPHQTAWRAIT